ncbi:formiminoglutamase [Cryobacterium mesophilum]|uniref:Formimidoylglutamase n=1 Tax=Terrimesophilobacter mesophilus TaxID=433647 RepID=A0A4R8V7U7_9MICO|nr:arginase family protein [Terrimesophilobacter mesophilus]MBB5632366.1 formiminoglutamase [Terrimesophilobacter mesophilus]TFB79204.1 formimidoylglutamase [Terrimesophilobacter mesophilus]
MSSSERVAYGSGLPVDPLWPRAGNWPVPSGHSDFALIGVPTWRTSISATNAGQTPDAVRAMIPRYSQFAHSGGRPLDFADHGNVPDPDADEAATIAMIGAVDTELLVALGGDNAATVPTALGRWGDRLATAGLVTVDAHYDLRDGVSNGSPVRRLIEAGLDGRRVVQVGISDFANSAEYAARARDLGITVVLRDELLGRPMADVMAEALEVAGSAGGPIHVDLDVDVCDRSVAPACPASVPGGIAAHELRAAARVAGKHRRVESIDLVEVDATADTPDARTVRLVALCVLEAAAGLALRS